MKLSKVLKDWPEKKPEETTDHTNPYWPYCQSYDGKRYYSIPENEGHNEALTSCDREIDREALAKVIYQENPNDIKWDGLSEPSKELYLKAADHIISTMPQWMKKV